MEVWGYVLLVVIAVAVVRYALKPSATKPINQPAPIREPLLNRAMPEQDKTERWVSDLFVNMELPVPYTVFNDVILPSYGGKTKHTQIDHVIVAQTGIFCIETKSHKGLIVGHETEYWYQYLGKKRYPIYSPTRQNYKHRKAIEALLGTQLRAPIHCYVVFPHAKSVKSPYKDVTNNPFAIVETIRKHTRYVYNLDAYQQILTTIAHATDQRGELAPIQKREVRALVLPISPEVHKW